MTMIDTSDTRFAKAVAIAETSGQWLRLRCRDGRKAYGIKASRGDQHYVTTRSSCSCEDQRRRPDRICKHRIAVEIVCARAAGKPLPSSVVVDGLTAMVASRRPALPAETLERPRRYDEIFARL